MTNLAGTGRLILLIVRLGRVRMAVWIVALVAIPLLVTSGMKSLYPTSAKLAEAAAAVSGSATQIALNGPARALDTLGGRAAFELWKFGLVGVGLMSLLLVAKHTRGEEELGRLELLRAAVVGRHAAIAAALAVSAGMSVAVGGGIAIGLILADLPVIGSVTFGAAIAANGLFFTAATLVAAQITESSRAAAGSIGALLGASFAVRAAGDINGGDGIIWLSPLGWAEETRPYADERWWPIAIILGATLGLGTLAAHLLSKRDLGAGIVGTRPGPPRASSSLRRPSGLARRLQRGTLVAWAISLTLAGVALGSLGQSVDGLVGDTPQIRDVLAGGESPQLTDSFFSTFLLLVAFLACGFGIQSVQRLRGEETEDRAEIVLATTVSRRRWMLGHVTISILGSSALLAAVGLGMGLAHGLATGDMAEVPRLIAASLSNAPPVWLLIGGCVALFGVLPRGGYASWALLVGCLIVGLLGELLGLPDWARAASPFQHVARLPAESIRAWPLMWLSVLSGALVFIGVTGFERRDLG